MDTRRPPPARLSNRAFGLAFTGVFCAIALLPLLRGGALRGWALAVAGAFLAAALLAPRALAPFNAAWTRIGMALNAVVGTLALAVLFYGVVAPTGLVMRMRGRDPLRLRRDPAAASYWIERDPPGPPPDSLTNQF